MPPFIPLGEVTKGVVILKPGHGRAPYARSQVANPGFVPFVVDNFGLSGGYIKHGNPAVFMVHRPYHKSEFRAIISPHRVVVVHLAVFDFHLGPGHISCGYLIHACPEGYYRGSYFHPSVSTHG